MKRKSILIAFALLVLLALVSCASSEKVDAKNMTDEQVLSLMENRGFNIYSPRFRVIYNDRLIYGPNFQEDYTPDLAEALDKAQTVEIVEESNTKAIENVQEEPIVEDMIEDVVEPEEEITYNKPIEYNIPENAFVSEGEEEAFDILAQWESFLAEEETQPVEEVTDEVVFAENTAPEEINIETTVKTTESATDTTETAEVPEEPKVSAATEKSEEVKATTESPENSAEESTGTSLGTVITLYEEEQKVVEPFIPSPYPVEPKVEEPSEELSFVDSPKENDVQSEGKTYTPLDWIMYVFFPLGSALACLICAIAKKHKKAKNKKM